MKRAFFLMFFAAIAVTRVHAVDSLVVYSAPTGARTSTAFTVTANGEPLPVYVDSSVNVTISQTLRYFVNFSMSGTVTMKVTWNLPFTKAIVRPVADNITPTVSGKSATFTFTGPRNISFESNDAGYGYNQEIPALYIFANPLEVNVPSPTDPAVQYYAPGYYNIGTYAVTTAKKTVYLAGGAYLNGRITVSGVNDVLIMGRGILRTRNASGSAIGVSNCSGFRMQGITFSHNDTHGFTVTHSNGVSRSTVDNIHILGDGENDDGFNISADWCTFNRVFSATHDDNYSYWHASHMTYLNCISRPGCTRGFQVWEKSSYGYYKGCKVLGVNPCNDMPALFLEYDDANYFGYENISIESKSGWMEARGSNLYLRNVNVLSPIAATYPNGWGKNTGGHPMTFVNLVHGGKQILQASDDASWTGTATFLASDPTAPTVTITSPTRSEISDVVIGPSTTINFTITNWAMASGGKGFHFFVNNVDQGVKYTTDPIAVSNLPIGPNSFGIKLVDATGTYTNVQDAIVVTVTNNPTVAVSTPLLRTATYRGASSKECRLIGIDGRSISSDRARMASSGSAASRPGIYVADVPGAGRRVIATVK